MRFGWLGWLFLGARACEYARRSELNDMFTPAMVEQGLDDGVASEEAAFVRAHACMEAGYAATEVIAVGAEVAAHFVLDSRAVFAWQQHCRGSNGHLPVVDTFRVALGHGDNMTEHMGARQELLLG